MKDYVIINGVSSKTKTGLAINILPPITKPEMRTLVEEIDGRDGDIITKLGYSAYDKTIEIGLFGNGYDVDDIIAFFNKEGTIIFSNEPTKYYNFTLVDSFDIERLLQFKTSTITFHCQPFKYEVGETPKEIEYDYVSGEGTEITLNNTMNALMELELNPSELTQETTTGKNLAKSAFDSKLYLTGSGDNRTVENADKYCSQIVKVKPSTTYTCSGTFTSMPNSMIRIAYFDNIPVASSVSTKFVYGGSPLTFTTGATTNYILLYNSQYDTNTVINDLQLEEGSSASSFEPYSGGIPQPNPDFPSDVQVIKGNNSIKIENKNLLYWTRPTLGTVVENDDGSFTLNYTYAQSLNMVMTGELSAGTYTIKNYGDIILYVQSSTSDYSHYASNDGGSYTFTYDGTSYLRFLYGNTTANTTQLFKVQLEKGSSATPYIAHQEQVLPLNLPSGMEYCKIGTYEDEFEHDGDKWYLNKYIGKRTLNGSESWGSSGSYYYLLFNDKRSLTTYTPNLIISNYFKAMQYSGGSPNIGCFSENYYTTGNRNVFFNYNGSSSDVDGFKTWLSTHNTTVYYVLATPTHDEITDTTLINQLNAIEQAVSYYEQTNISQTNTGLPFRIKATAVIIGSDSVEITNNGNVYAKPILDIKGAGIINVYLNGTQMFSVDITDEIIVDIPNLETYNPNTSALMNRNVTGNISNFILPVGTNTITVDGAVEKVTITMYQRWL